MEPISAILTAYGTYAIAEDVVRHARGVVRFGRDIRRGVVSDPPYCESDVVSEKVELAEQRANETAEKSSQLSTQNKDEDSLRMKRRPIVDGVQTIRTVDLFAGCGGLTRGLEWAGIECMAFNEINKDAADSFALNFPEAIRLDGDIRTAVSNDVIDEIILPAAGDQGVDIVCGGPPCQGYSGIGHRRSFSVEKADIPTNHLFHEMIRVIERIQPRAFLFENVQGLLSSKWTSSGESGEIFRDVWKAFSSIQGYVAQPTLIHAYGFGVPQNRPRIMIMGVRESIIEGNGIEARHFDPSTIAAEFQSQLRNNGGLFPMSNGSTAPGVKDAISDLEFDNWTEDEMFHRNPPQSEFQRLMRKELGRYVKKHRLTDHFVSNHSPKVRDRFQYMIDNQIVNIGGLPEHMRTKKFSQKLLPEDWGDGTPTITCCSNSDDYVHYSMPRALSVREWARLQTFPDHHLFSGPRTTGGVRRAGNPDKGIWDREVPKYTQIGNAVPPLLAQAIGIRMAELISQAELLEQ